tara:strand:+ start:37133 stop:37510 length:378 start_codon:yes stop_codon:yes gene_type:complete
MQLCYYQILVGRVLLGFFFVAVGILNIIGWDSNINILYANYFPMPELLLGTAIAAEIILGLFVAIGMFHQVAALLLILFTIFVAPIYLDFWNLSGPAMIATLVQFLSDIAVIGGLLMVSGTKHTK